MNDTNQQSGGSSPYGRAQNVTDIYKTNNAYAAEDNYAKRMPYEKNEDGGLGVCSFWFDLKVKMQELMSSDIGLQSEERIVTMDTDPFKLALIYKMTTRSFWNLMHVWIVVILSYVLYIKANELFKLTIAVLDIMYIMWVLWCPGHQTFTSGAYAIHKNTVALYTNWRLQFKFYQTVTILGFVVGTVIIAGVSYFNGFYNLALSYVQMAFDYIHYPVQIGVASRAEMQEAAITITVINGVGVLGYFLFISYLAESAKKQRAEYKRTNIVNRTASHLEQKKTRMRGG